LTLRQCLHRGEDLFRPCTNPVIFRQIHPSHSARGVKEELGWARDVVSAFAGSGVDQIVSANNIQVGVGENVELESGFFGQLTRLFGRVNADCDDTNTGLLQFLQVSLDSPQLGEAERSPVSAIENDYEAFW
jgi:hypothetical protein